MGIRKLIAAVALLSGSLAFADVTEERNFNYELSDGGRFSLDNINGDVTVTGGTGNAVEISALLKADSQELLDDINIDITATEDSIRIDTRHPEKKSWFGWSDKGGVSVTYTVSVPTGARLDGIESVNGDVTISGVYGSVKAETVNGRIDARDLSSDAKLETVNGAVYATFASLTGDQDVECDTVNGKVTLYLPDNADASVTAETVNGGIDADEFGLKTNKGFVGRDLRGEIGNGEARVNLSTVNGSIKIRKG